MKSEPIICSQCEKEITGEPVVEEYYRHCDDDAGEKYYFCPEENEEDGCVCRAEYEDQSYIQFCEVCGRYIADGGYAAINFISTPANMDDKKTMSGDICYKCHREHTLAHGLALADLQNEEVEVENYYSEKELE
jgi:hypothetical protein